MNRRNRATALTRAVAGNGKRRFNAAGVRVPMLLMPDQSNGDPAHPVQ